LETAPQREPTGFYLYREEEEEEKTKLSLKMTNELREGEKTNNGAFPT
jgi:hypothetical protein